MTSELDALVDHIWLKLSADRSSPTAVEAKEVGLLALRLAGEMLPPSYGHSGPAAELDALVDHIWLRLSADRSPPTAVEAQEVGLLALRLAGEEPSGRPGSVAAAAAAVPDRYRQPASEDCLLPTSEANCTPSDRPLPGPIERRTTPLDGGPPASAVQWRGRGTALLDDELKERLLQLRASKADVRQHAAAVSAICADILDGLKRRYPHTFDWRICNSGSYFDKTKVGRVSSIFSSILQ